MRRSRRSIGFKSCCPGILERLILFSIVISAYFVSPGISETVFGSSSGLYISITTILYYTVFITVVKAAKHLIARVSGKKK